MSRLGGKTVRAGQHVRAVPVTEAVPDALADFDTQLMLQVREGNREAANALVRRNTDRIARYIARLVGPGRSVEDLTQDVFLKALTHASSYQPTARVSTWLYHIATNLVLNDSRSRASRRRTSGPWREDQPEAPDHRTASPDRRLHLSELQKDVAAAICELPVNQRIALTLFEYENCPYEEIAGVLETSVSAVRSMLNRARTALRERLRTHA